MRGRDAKRLRAEVTVAQSTDLQDRRWRHLECSMEFFLSNSQPDHSHRVGICLLQPGEAG